ncbi:MAG TPA: ATP-grasp domain-containing protein [Natronosporangium sp.]
MTDTYPPVVLIGYSAGVLAYLSRFLPDSSIVVVEEPDVVGKRGVHAATVNSTVLRKVVEWEYQLDAAADSFYHHHRDLRPGAVVPIIEYGVPFAARLAERYGVPGAGYGAALALRDKRLQRAITAAAGIPNPRSVQVDGPEQVAAVMAELGGPVVLKPANRQAAVGTKILRDPSEVPTAWLECLDQEEGELVPDRPMPLRMLVEQFIEGEEFSVEMMVYHGRSWFGGVTRKFLFDGPRPIEQGHLHPADIDQLLADRLLADTERVVDALGMDCGFVHCEWMVQDGVPYLVECAGRMAGDGIIELVDMTWDYDVVGEFYAMMQGKPLGPPPPPKASRFAATWTTAPPAVGRIERVEGVEAAKAVPGVRTVAAPAVGSETHPLRSSGDRPVLVTAAGDTPAAALANAQRAAELVRIEVRPAD